MKYLPKLQQLKVFQQVIRSGSIRGAARAMNQSQPAVSRTLRELEQILDTQLIVRGTQGMTLTETGRAFSQRMQFILEELQRAADEIQQINQFSQGSVAVGFSSLLALTIFPALASEFTAQYPQAKLHIKESQLSTLLPSLREGRLDFAIGTLGVGLPIEDMVCEPLFSAPFCVVARRQHPLAQATSLSELREASWLLPETDMGYYQQLAALLEENGCHAVKSPIRTDSLISGLMMMLNGDYLSVVGNAMATPFFMEDKLCRLPVDSLPAAQYCLVYSQKTPLTLTARRFLDLLRLHCQRYPW
ncbi:LysR substrate-binding domain-containing protein [Rouxiella badensis]|jgi:LysR family tdc operon transcriptional activator|uniref:LysR substrate-binding domain-containing protein n=1 Tax=Rouxiella badensis TaxID=1646377 RepID=UPI001D151DB0|nr:LysR substrate-binding domain-containing protein [Rouxiella badensis]MCC3702705.1 LysR family transcriptional regulator [Rouxiella badensis]WAT08506.1 LysR substrate-binding domain-containing protein [Rouxiella badensis]